ncbi:MAG TPA: decarboxylase, partial [Anaerolineae bacterium]|nr:decarboxylase [Anaerolineae bacterium]
YAPLRAKSERWNWVNRELVGAMVADGYAMLSSTVLNGRTVLRMCTINPRTTATDIRETLYGLDRMGKKLLR